jgi:hypothetical protein
MAAGIAIPVAGEQKVVFARLSNVLTDGDGHRLAWDWRGAASLKPCIKHCNVLKKCSDLAARKPGYAELDARPAQCRSWTRAQFFEVVDSVLAASERVAAGTMTKAAWHDLQLVTGFNANPHGLLWSRPLRHVIPRSCPQVVVRCGSIGFAYRILTSLSVAIASLSALIVCS